MINLIFNSLKVLIVVPQEEEQVITYKELLEQEP